MPSQFLDSWLNLDHIIKYRQPKFLKSHVIVTYMALIGEILGQCLFTSKV